MLGSEDPRAGEPPTRIELRHLLDALPARFAISELRTPGRAYPTVAYSAGRSVIQRFLEGRHVDPEEVRALVDTSAQLGRRWTAAKGKDPYAAWRAEWEGIFSRMADALERGYRNPASASERIRSRRIEHDLTQEQLADKLGVQRRQVIRWETGAQAPGRRHCLALAGVLGGQPADYYESEV